jgi:outer membrane protein
LNRHLYSDKNKKMKHTHFPLLIMILLIVARVSAQSITSLTLSKAINSAFSNRKNIEAGKIDVQIQQLLTKALYKKFGPQVSAEYNYNYNPILQSSIIPVGKFNSSLPPDATANIQFGTTWSQSAGITAIQPLFDATIKKQINESRLQEKISSATQAQSQYELAYDVAEAYINTWLQQQQINSAIIDTTRTWFSYQLQLDKFTAGRLLKSELNKAIINHNNTKQQLVDATIQLLANKIYLLFVTGTTAADANDFNIDTAFFNNNSLLPVDKNGAKFSLDSMPVFQQLQLQQQLSSLQQQTEKAKYIPKVSLQGFLGANQYSNEFNPVKSNTWFGYSYIGLNVKIPLLLGEDKNKKIQQLQLQSQQYDKQLQDKSAQYKQDAATAILEIERIKNKLTTQETNLVLYQESLNISQERLKEGQIISLELNNQEQELQQLIAAYENTKKQLWLYRLSYLKASGQLSKLWE